MAINRQKYSFPVGKVDEINMYPLDFEEFLWAMNREKLAEEIKAHYAENTAMSEALHQVALELYRKYFIVGGMPAAVDLINFKLYMGDIGMLTLRSEIPLQTILSTIEVDNTFLGTMTENYVAQVFATKGYKLLHWQSEGKAEVDFVLQIDGAIVPIEVKKGTRNRSKSLVVFVEKYKSAYSIRISKKNFGFENGIKSVPLYAVFCI
jgi:predicted AAA+ superfamily ATPase